MYNEELVVPIIENTPWEEDLKERMAEVMDQYPETCAVLVRRHGVYVWGDTWERAKTMYVYHNLSFQDIFNVRYLLWFTYRVSHNHSPTSLSP